MATIKYINGQNCWWLVVPSGLLASEFGKNPVAIQMKLKSCLDGKLRSDTPPKTQKKLFALSPDGKILFGSFAENVDTDKALEELYKAFERKVKVGELGRLKINVNPLWILSSKNPELSFDGSSMPAVVLTCEIN